MHKPLRAMISDAVVQYVTYKLHAKEPVDVALIAGEITLSLLDLVMEQDEKHQAAAYRSHRRHIGRRISRKTRSL
jgi:DNA-binding protein Fis